MEFQIDPTDPDRMIRKKRSTRFVMLIWLLVLLMVFFWLYAFIGGHLLGSQSSQIPIAIVFCTLLATIITLRTSFNSKVMILDRRRMVLVQRLSIYSGMSRQEVSIRPDAEVVITRDIRAGGQQSGASWITVYPVRIRYNLTDAANIEEADNYEIARETAESIAGFLHIRLTDDTEGGTRTSP